MSSNPIGGAVLEDGDGTDLAQVYNPKNSLWTEVAPMQIARSGSAACVLKGKIYVIGERTLILVWSQQSYGMMPITKTKDTHVYTEGLLALLPNFLIL